VVHVKHENPFQRGYNAVTEEGERTDNAMMDFGILLLHAGECHECHLGKERAFLLMHGNVEFRFNGVERPANRQSLLEESPVVLHNPRSITTGSSRRTGLAMPRSATLSSRLEMGTR
jgi:5-deoxy-glucuronate isomerase